MSDTKTEWLASEYQAVGGRRFWRVRGFCEDGREFVFGLDKPTAHLIAAAKEMEAALKAVKSDNQWGWDHNGDTARKVDAALAKTRGET